MPLYEYRCTSCGYKFEKIQKFSDTPDTVCPKCQGELIRPMTAPALRFEGAGWYVNDYAGKGAAKSESSSNGASSEAKTGDSKAASSESATTPAPAAAPASAPSSTASSGS